LAFTDCLQTAVQGFAHWTLLDPVGTWVNFWGLSRAFHFSAASDPHRTPTPSILNRDSRLPLHCISLKRFPFYTNHPPVCRFHSRRWGVYFFETCSCPKNFRLVKNVASGKVGCCDQHRPQPCCSGLCPTAWSSSHPK
jgi:hypothetical protein